MANGEEWRLHSLPLRRMSARGSPGARPDISVILMSGYSGTQLSERAHSAGITDVLSKPLRRRDIAEPVARALYGGH